MNKNTNSEKPIYLVLTADIVESRQLSTRQLAGIAQHLKIFDDALLPVIPSALFAGDEIQALFYFDQQHHPYWLVFATLAIFNSIHFRFGFGAGRIDEPINPTIAQNKGDAFLQARSALIQARDNNVIASFKSNFDLPLREINAMFILLSAITKKWSAKHWRRFFLYAKYGSIYQVAQCEGVSPEAINKSLNTASVRAILQSLTPFLNENILSTIIVDIDKYQP